MNRKRLILTSVISIILVSILMIGSTYSIFVSTEVDENTNVYTTGILDITYTVDSNEITLADSSPLSDDSANTVTPYRLTVTNNGTVPYMFDLALSDTTAGDVIDYQYIMTKVGDLEYKSLSGCTNNVIKEDIVLGPGDSVDIDVRIWISDTIPNTELGNSFYATFTITGDAIHHDNEEIDNSILSLNYMKGFSGSSDTSYFHDATYQQYIKNVSFVDYIDTSSAVASWDMSVAEDESIMAWVVNNEAGEEFFDLYIGSNQTIYAKDLQYFFFNMKLVDDISFANLDTSLTTNMSYMFDSTGYSSTVFTLDLSDNFDTFNVTSMDYMFYMTGWSSTVFTLDLGDKFDTSNVTSMSYMFELAGRSSTVLTLNLGEKFDTSNVINMKAMFASIGYSNTRFTLDLGEKFDTSNVTNMRYMFYYTGYSSTGFTLDLGEKFNTSNVTDMSYMFYDTGTSNPSLSLDLSTFDFASVTTYDSMFNGFSTTQTIYVKDTTAQSWILNKGFTNLSTSNVLVKS